MAYERSWEAFAVVQVGASMYYMLQLVSFQYPGNNAAEIFSWHLCQQLPNPNHQNY